MRLSRGKTELPDRQDYAMLRIGGEGWQNQQWVEPLSLCQRNIETRERPAWLSLREWELRLVSRPDNYEGTENCLLLVKKIGFWPNNSGHSYAHLDQWEDIEVVED